MFITRLNTLSTIHYSRDSRPRRVRPGPASGCAGEAPNHGELALWSRSCPVPLLRCLAHEPSRGKPVLWRSICMASPTAAAAETLRTRRLSYKQEPAPASANEPVQTSQVFSSRDGCSKRTSSSRELAEHAVHGTQKLNMAEYAHQESAVGPLTLAISGVGLLAAKAEPRMQPQLLRSVVQPRTAKVSCVWRSLDISLRQPVAAFSQPGFTHVHASNCVLTAFTSMSQQKDTFIRSVNANAVQRARHCKQGTAAARTGSVCGWGLRQNRNS